MNCCILHQLKQWHVLAQSQFGFHFGHEVVEASSQLVEEIVAVFHHREVVKAVTLDIQSVYDTVLREGLIRKMEVIRMDLYITALLYCFLSSRCCNLEVAVLRWRLHWTAAYHKAPQSPPPRFVVQ